MKLLSSLSLFLLLACNSTPTIKNHPPTIIWHWEDDFLPEEQKKLVQYFTEVAKATQKVLGPYPFDVHFYLHKSDGQKEPIPWAHTERSEIEGVHFYVCPTFDLDVFRADWTAPHEISHLALPFLGQSNAWFSEGFATYMQLQIMQEMGVYSKEEVMARYQMKDRNVKDDFSLEKNFLDEVRSLRKRYNFPAMYWGSVRYFRCVNRQLLAQGEQSLVDQIKAYQKQNRNQDESFDSVIKSLDAPLKVPLFQQLLKKCSQEPFETAFD